MAPALAIALASISLLAEPPRLEIVSSAGALDGPEASRTSSPEWERMRIELDVANRLSVPARDLVLDVALVETPGPHGEPEPIPGWTYRGLRVEGEIPAGRTTRLEIERALPKRRRCPPASVIAYQVQIRSYRADPPDLDLAFELLGSSHGSDQRAALRSFELDPAWPMDQVETLRGSLRRALETLPEQPSATDALRMLLAVRGMGSLSLASEVPLLLALPDRLDREAWGRAVLDLASRMVVASSTEDPRLSVLPRWARRVATLLRINARDALEDATREAIGRIGDAAVPWLVRAAALGPTSGVKARARRLLDFLGRSTPRAQLASRDPSVRSAVALALGEVGDPGAVPALTELLKTHGPARHAAEEALLTIGAPAIEPLAKALAQPGVAAVREVLVRLGRAHPEALGALAASRGLRLQGRRDAALDPALEAVTAIAAAATRARVERLEAEIADAFALGAEGAYRAALERLDAVEAEDPELYRRHADPIARLFVARAGQLLERGDYEAAIRVLETGQRVKPLPEAEMRLTDARVALARGFIELGDLAQAERELDAVPVRARLDVYAVRADWLSAAARAALEGGRRGEARRLVDEGRALDASSEVLRALDRRLFLGEHLAVILILGLSLPALGLLGAVVGKRQLDKRSMERLSRRLDALP